jgi:hypothetical protein
LGKLTSRRRQVRRSRPQVILQLRHLRLEGRLLASSSLRGLSGSGLYCGRGGLGSLSHLLRGRCSHSEFLDLSLASASLDASESLSVTAAMAAVSAEMARSSAD